MAKFFRCWVIVAGSQPTAFRARQPEDLLPTLRQLQRTQPDVDLKWFERGRLWPSPEAAAQALKERRGEPAARGRGWRPGGEHKDPRAKYDIPRDEKRARFKKRLIGRKPREGETGSPFSRPSGKGHSSGSSSDSSPRPPYRPSQRPQSTPSSKPFGISRGKSRGGSSSTSGKAINFGRKTANRTYSKRRNDK